MMRKTVVKLEEANLMRYINEQVAWRLLALAFEGDPVWDGDVPGAVVLGKRMAGLCGAIGRLRDKQLISLRTAVRMWSRYETRRSWNRTVFKWPRDIDRLRARARFCRKQARVR
jgi:hypothetical protein